MTPEEEVYEKLFRALEEDAAKQESDVLDQLRAHFGLPGQQPVSVELIDLGVPAVDVFAEVLRLISPFGRMLSEIYSFLADRRSTISGKADKFAFRFAELDGRVAFPLDAFPKTWIEVAATASIRTSVVDPDRHDDLLIDGPVYTRDVNALNNLGTHPLPGTVLELTGRASDPRAGSVLDRHPGVLDEIHATAEETLAAAARSLIYHPHRGLDATEHLYFRDLSSLREWERALTDARDTDDRYAAQHVSWEFREAGRLFDLSDLHRFLDPAAAAPRGWYFDDEAVFDEWLTLFRRAADAALRRIDDPVEVMARVADEVMLPFWRHRWRLYEVWALILVMRRPPPSAVAIPRLESRPDGDGEDFDWPIPHGDAGQPVGQFVTRQDQLDVWFQRKTLGRAGKNIEPDVRVMTTNDRDVAILELKDRHLGPGAHPRGVAELYAEQSEADLVVVANYSPFRGAFASAGPEQWSHAGSAIIVAETLRPNEVPDEVLAALDEALSEALPEIFAWDLLVDVSGSMAAVDLPATVRELIEEKGTPRAAWTFSTELRPVLGDVMADLPYPNGVTRAAGALRTYLDGGHLESVLELVVITDRDGADQMSANIDERNIDLRVC